MLIIVYFIRSPYAQPREQTYMQRVDVVQSMKILRADLLHECAEPKTAAAHKQRMGVIY